MAPTARISQGLLRGVLDQGVVRYLGVPYAAAPVGDLRFAAPEPHPGWGGERDASQMGATAPQGPWGPDLAQLLPTVFIPGDEYLNVNIWAPEGASDLPVMVWVHGGALNHGSNSLEQYDGTRFARGGIVLVSVNYRLGVEGFAVAEGVPANLGLADVVAALRWVRAEIASFGGDPRRVTISGESAGSILVGNVLVLAEVEELCSQVILQSGLPRAESLETGAQVPRLVAERLGVPPTRDGFCSVAPADLIEAQESVLAGQSPLTGGPHTSLSLSGPDDPAQRLASGAGARIPALIGTTAEEARLWVRTSPLSEMDEPTLRGMLQRMSVPQPVADLYTSNRPGAQPGDIAAAILTDTALRLPTYRLADLRLRFAAKTWVFEFGWRSPVRQLGAAHAMDVSFVFDTLDSEDALLLAGPDAPQQVADDMHGAWLSFVKTGDPGWEPWNERRPVTVFDTPESGVVYAPRDDERLVWSVPSGPGDVTNAA